MDIKESKQGSDNKLSDGCQTTGIAKQPPPETISPVKSGSRDSTDTKKPDLQSENNPEFIVSRQFREIFHGPIPSPKIMEGYEEISPGAANRILKMAEKQQAHRHQMENNMLSAAASKDKRGQWFAGALAIIALASATFLGYHDKTFVASIIGGTTIIGLCGIFALGKFYKTKNSENSK